MTAPTATSTGFGTTAQPGELLPTAPVTGTAADFPPPVPSSTPQLLRRLQVLVVVAVLIAGAVCAWVIADLRTDLASAPNLAQQYARLGQVQHAVDAAADSAAKSVLAGESASGTNAKAAVAALGTANGLLVDAAKDRPQDAGALRTLGDDLVSYTIALSAALGEPLAQARPLLVAADTPRDALLTGIGNLQAGLSTEASTRPWSQSTPWAAIACLVMLAVVVWASWVVARRSHRVLNVGLVGVGITLVVMLISVGAAQGTAAAASDTSRDTQFAHVVNLATGVREFDTAQRVLTTAVLTQTWNDSSDATWTKASKAANAAIKDESVGANSLNAAAKSLVALLAKGDWKAASTALTSTSASALDSASSAFRTATQKVSDKAVTAAASAPESARATLGFLLAMIAILSVVGAGLGVFGIARRLQEFR